MAARSIFVVGGSAGSIEVVSQLARGLPPDFPAAVFVVVHFPGSAPSILPRILSRAGQLPAIHPDDGDRVTPGHIYVARPDCHLEVEDGRVRLHRGPKENGHRPAIDPLFRSAAKWYGNRVVGVVLSGNLNDGSAGLLAIKRQGGVSVVQDPETAMFPGMPRSAIDNVPVDHVVPVDQMADLLVGLAHQDVPELEASPMKPEESIFQPESETALADRHTQPGVPSTMSCPECHGILWESREGDMVRFRCRVGHAYSAEALFAHQSDQLEAALWTAFRALEEHAALSRRLAAQASMRDHQYSASAFTEQAMNAEHYASTIRNVLQSGVRIESVVPLDSIAGA